MHERQLAYVVAAVEEGSFTDAAARCGVAQPSLSAAVARLERELGVALFDRVGRTIVPTDACRALLPSARDVLRAGAAARDAVSAVRAGFTGTLDLAVQPTVIRPVVDLVAAYRERHPGVDVRLRSPADEPVGELVASGVAEVGIGDVGDRADLVWTRLWVEPYVCIDRREGVGGGARSRPCRPSTLAGLALVAPPPGSPTRAALEAWMGADGRRPDVRVEVDHREALVPLVAAGAGAAVVPRSMAEDSPTGVRIRTLDPPLERPIGLAHRPVGPSPAAAALVELAARSVPASRRRRR